MVNLTNTCQSISSHNIGIRISVALNYYNGADDQAFSACTYLNIWPDVSTIACMEIADTAMDLRAEEYIQTGLSSTGVCGYTYLIPFTETIENRTINQGCSTTLFLQPFYLLS